MKLREGIIVKSQKFQENSKIITLINSEGLNDYLVRGALNQKSKNFSYSNELTKIGFDYHAGKNSFNILTTGKVLNNFSQLKTDFNKLNDSLLMIEATNQLGKHIEDFQTFYQFLNDILQLLNDNHYNQYYLIIFRLKLLYLVGIGPIFSKCVKCESRENLVGFDFLSGGMKCQNCVEKTDIYYNKDVIDVLRFLYLTKLDVLSIDILDTLPNYFIEITKFLDHYYDHYLGYQSRADKIIKKMKMN